MTAVQELIRHLKSNPKGQNASELAIQFGVSERLVALAIANMTRDGDVPVKRRFEVPSVFTMTPAWWQPVSQRPTQFFALSSGLTLAMVAIGGNYPLLLGLNVGQYAVMAALFVVPLIQFAFLFLAGNAKSVAMGTLMNSTACTVGLAATGGFKTDIKLILAFVFVWFFMYVAFATLATVTGSFWRMKREAKATAKMTRQQMLDRLLYIRSVLESDETATEQSTKQNSLIAWLERNAVWVAFVWSMLLGTAFSMVFRQIDPEKRLLSMPAGSKPTMTGISSGLLFGAMLVSILQNTSNFAIGLLCKRFRQTALVIFAYIVGHEIVTLTPISYISISDMQVIGLGRYVTGWISFAVLTCLGTMARQVYDFARSRARSKANDPGTLMEEMLDLEWRLTPRSSDVTVLAVDVAGSTDMKRGADPLVAEWTFREYQSWVEKTCASFGGKVHATAGDGAIVGFEGPRSAFEAAQALQGRLAEFNDGVNKLDQKFVIRVGLHMGSVQGELSDVQFTRVIDVAAHIEALAPRGGIAASEPVANELPDCGFQLAAATTDGHSVYIAT